MGRFMLIIESQYTTTKEFVMKLFVTSALFAFAFGSVGTAFAETIALSCRLDVGRSWDLSLDLEAKTLRNPIGPPVEITQQNRSWIIAQTSKSFAAASETRSGDFASAQSWVINRITGELWVEYFLGTSSESTPIVMRTHNGQCVQSL